MVSLVPSQKSPSPIRVAAFDFDGTLTHKDSFRAFLEWLSPPSKHPEPWLAMAPALVRYGFDRDRGRLKAAAVRLFLAGMSRAEVEDACERFAQSHWDHFIRPDARATWERWRGDGAQLVVVTASPDVLVAPFARRLGADGILGTRLAYDSQGRALGAFEGENCRGAEKVVRLKAAYGDDVDLVAAYGDSAGDREMLAVAREAGYRVFTARP